MPALQRLAEHRWTIMPQQDGAIQSKVSISVVEILERTMEHTSCVQWSSSLIVFESHLEISHVENTSVQEYIRFSLGVD